MRGDVTDGAARHLRGIGPWKNGPMPATIKSIRFLLVEDHPIQREMLELTLRSMGASEIRTAANGGQALKILREPWNADVVISDLLMPDVDGLELIPMLAKLVPAPWLLLASSSDWPLEIGRTMAEAHGVAVLAAVPKPLSPAKLGPLIDTYLAAQPETRPPET